MSPGELLKARFLDDYRKAVAEAEPRLSRNVELTVSGKAFDESGKVETSAVVTFRANADRASAKEQMNPGNHLNWYLLCPEGIYRIKPIPSNPNEYFLKRFRPGTFSASEAGTPFTALVHPLVRINFSLRDHIASDSVTVLKDHASGSCRELQVTETIGDSTGNTTYRFRDRDLFLQEVFDTDGVRYRLKYHYVNVEGQAFPSRIERFTGQPGGGMRFSSEVVFGPYRRATFPDADFSPRRFGIPEHS